LQTILRVRSVINRVTEFTKLKNKKLLFLKRSFLVTKPKLEKLKYIKLKSRLLKLT
jgi:hypothetical protein